MTQEPPPRLVRQISSACLLGFLYLALTLAITYPLPSHFTTHHVGEGGGDARVYLWNYWWVDQALFELGTSPFETDRIFHPIGIGLSLHTLAFTQGVAHALLRGVTGPVTAANLIVFWTFLASALATYALARRWGATADGAFLAGMVFAFCPYRLARLSGHYDLLGTEWIPVYVLLLLELAESRTLRPVVAIAAGVAAAICGYTALSYLAFLALFTIVFLAYHARRFPVLAPRLAVVALVVLASMAPLLVQMHHDLTTWTYPPYPGADRYVADLAAFVVPPASSTLLPGRGFGDNSTEGTVFTGYVVLVLAAIGRRNRFWMTGAAVFFALSLGGSLHVAGRDTGIPLPFRALAEVPLLEHLRAPSRLTVMMMLCLAMMAALSWKPRRRRWTALVAALIAAEYLTAPVPLFETSPHPVYAQLAESDPSATVVEIPGIEQSPGLVMDHQRIHERPVFVGTAARVPLEKSEYWLGLPLVRSLIDLRKGRIALTPELVERERDAAPEIARFLGLGDFVIDKAYAKRGVVDFVEAVLPVDRRYEDDVVVWLSTRRGELPPNPHRIEPDALSSRQHFESGWMRPELEGETAFRWAHRRRSTLLFRRPSSTAGIVLEIAPLDGGASDVSVDLDGQELGTAALRSGWQELSWDLPAKKDDGVERLTLRWSALARASDRDPRELAARIRRIRFVEGNLPER